MGYFLLTYDESSMRVLAFTSHGQDFIGAVLALAGALQQHRSQPSVVVRLYAAISLQELLTIHRDLFSRLEFPAGD